MDIAPTSNPTPAIGDHVTIVVSNKQGRVIGIWHRIHRATEFDVEYIDDKGSAVTMWCTREEITRN